MATKQSRVALRFVPATLITGFCLTLLLFSPDVTEWTKPWFYGLFLKGKGAPPASHSVAVVSAATESGELNRESLTTLVKSILQLHPKILAINLSATTATDPALSNSAPTQGDVVIAHGFHSLQPWVFTDAGMQPYSSILSHSLYPLLDGPSQALNLPMGQELEMSDTLLKWSWASTGFSWPLERKNLYFVQAFARLGRGVVGNLAVEAVRRSLGISAQKVGYLDGIGVLIDADHVLPLDSKGRMYLRFHSEGDIPRLSATSLMNGGVPIESVRGRIVFLDAVALDAPGIKTPTGHRSATEIWSEAAAGILDKTLITAPAWGSILPIILGIIFSSLVILTLVLDFSSATVLALALFLAGLYPFIAFVIFVKSSLWLPPALPAMMVAVSFIPFFAVRLLFPTPVQKSMAIPPTSGFDPVLLSMASGGARPGAARTGLSQTPPRGIPVQAAAPSIANPSPPLRFSDPRDPPIIPSPNDSAPSDGSKDVMPRHAHPAPTPAYQAPAAPVHTGNISDDIERDAKGGLIRVGKYKIVRKMGFGSAGDVFEGFDTHMGRKVAIKTITKNASAHFDRAAERFVLEAKAAGSLNHPCINTVYDFGTVREVSYMVLEYLDGITLSQWMRNNTTPPMPQAVAHWLQQISSALDFAHGHKVIHRDLKPANLMVVNNGATIKLLDFGIAKMEDVGLTQTGMTVGTPSYMSPEQLSGLKVSPASDQYGLAVVIYQLLTYKLPYIGTKIPELCNRILKNELVPILEFNPALGVAFWEALRKGMSKTPEDRYANCTEMYQALEAAFPLTDPAYV